MTDIFVYYRVREENASELRARVLSMQAGLAARFRVAASLKRRSDEPGGSQTWMEIYAAAPAGFLPALHHAVRGAAGHRRRAPCRNLCGYPMCLIVFAWKLIPQCPLVLAANRDEFFERPTQPAR